jgi:hypothetical protein
MVWWARAVAARGEPSACLRTAAYGKKAGTPAARRIARRVKRLAVGADAGRGAGLDRRGAPLHRRDAATTAVAAAAATGRRADLVRRFLASAGRARLSQRRRRLVRTRGGPHALTSPRATGATRTP